MGDINIVTQPINPNEAATALANPTKPEATSEQPSSTTEQSTAGEQAGSAMEKLIETMTANMEKMNAEIQSLKSANATSALVGTAESSSSTIEESMADFFGY